jgi:hypothetical protein
MAGTYGPAGGFFDSWCAASVVIAASKGAAVPGTGKTASKIWKCAGAPSAMGDRAPCAQARPLHNVDCVSPDEIALLAYAMDLRALRPLLININLRVAGTVRIFPMSKQ